MSHRMIIEDAYPHFQSIISVADGEIYGYEVLGRNSGGKSLGDYFSNPDISESDKLTTDRIIREKAFRFFPDPPRMHGYLSISIHPGLSIPWTNPGKEKMNYSFIQ